MPPNQLNGITCFTPGKAAIRCCWAAGSGKTSETECRVIMRSGFECSLPRDNSVRIVASVIIKNRETTRLEIVSRVRRLLRRIFFRISLLNFMAPPGLRLLAIPTSYPDLIDLWRTYEITLVKV